MFIEINPNFPGIEGQRPAPLQVFTDASYATVTAAGFLNSATLQVSNLSPTDFALVTYAYVPATGVGTFGIFTLSIASTGVITLVPYVGQGNVLLPVVDGNVPKFNGTTGQIEDSGASLSDAAKTKIVMANAASVVGQIPKYTDTAGTIGTIGAGVIAATTAAYAGGGTSNAYTATGLTASSIVTAVILASTNAVSIAKAVPGTNLLTVTFSADPGAATTVSYIAFTGAAS
jgi:hypothetical protein